MSYGERFTNRYYGLTENGHTPVYEKWVIFKRDYAGSVEEVNGRAIINTGKQGNENPFVAVVPSACTIELVATSVDQFDELDAEDERELKTVVYRHNGVDWDVYWTGYGLTGQYFRQYVQQTNYEVSFTAVDMLENLKEIDFGGDSYPMERISVMAGIIMCLQETELDLDIYEGVQLVITGVSETFDETSALETAYFDPLLYYHDGEPESCLDVLTSLLESVGARVYQANGRWNVESVTFKTTGTFSVRTRDFEGAETGAGYEETEPRILLRKSVAEGSNRVCFQDKSQTMKKSERFGNIHIIYDYGLIENSLLKSEFVAIDLAGGDFDGWTVDVSDQTGTDADATLSIVNAVDGETRRENVLQIDFLDEGISTNLAHAAVKATPVELAATDDPYLLKISFDVFASATDPNAYIEFDYRIWVDIGGTPYYLRSDAFPLTALSPTDYWLSHIVEGVDEDGYLRVYLEHEKWTTITHTIRHVGLGSLGDDAGTLHVDFYAPINGPFNVDGIDALRDVVTDVSTAPPYRRSFANRTRVHYTEGGADYMGQYSLVSGDDDDAPPEVVVPDDWASPFGMVWKLGERVIPFDQGTEPHAVPWCRYIQLHNVVCEYLPNEGEAPEESSTHIALVNVNTRHDLEVTINHGDLPDDENYRAISQGWLSYSDGTPTEGQWSIRTGSATTQLPLVSHLGYQYKGQFNARRFKLNGTVNTMRLMPSFFNTYLEPTTGKVYIPLYLREDVKNALAELEILEAIQGDAIEDTGQAIDPADLDIPIEPPPAEAGRIHSAAFSAAFN